MRRFNRECIMQELIETKGLTQEEAEVETDRIEDAYESRMSQLGKDRARGLE